MGVVSQNRGITGSIYIPPSGGGGGGGMITNVTGVVANNNTLTITGTNLIQENKTNWDPYFTSTHPTASGFEGTSYSADGYDGGEPTLPYQTTVKLMGSQAAHMTDGAPVYGWFTIPAMPDASAWTDFWLTIYARWTISQWPDQYWKFWWMSGGTRYAFFQLYMNAGAAPTQWWLVTNSVDPNPANEYSNQFNIPDGAVENNRWYLIEFHATRQDAVTGGATPILEAYIDNQLILGSLSPAAGISPRGDRSGWQTNVNSDSTIGGPTGDLFHDRFVCSSQRVGPAALIEIGNGSSVYASATKKWQPPVLLSDTSCQSMCKLPSGGGPYWLWVTNNSGTRSQAWAL